MSRQEIVSSLKIIREGIKEKDKYLSEKIGEYQYEEYMDYIPVKPLPPEEVIKPSNEKDRFLDQCDINKKKSHYNNDPRDVKFHLEKWQTIILIVSLVLAALTAIIGAIVIANAKNEQPSYVCYDDGWGNYTNCGYDYSSIEGAHQRGITTLIVAGGMAAVAPVILIISLLRFIIQKTTAINGIPKQDKEYKEYLIRLNALNKEKQEKALIDYAEYEKKLDEYEKLQNQFLQEMSDYEKEYNDQKEIALSKIRNINKDLDDKANKALEDALKEANFDYPEKYYSNISAIINIFEDMRADNLKEAIAVMLDDEHKQTLEMEARFATLRADKAAADAEQAMLSQKGMQQCSQCSRKYTCYKTKDNDGSCWDFDKR